MPKFRWFLLAALIVHLGIFLQWSEKTSLYSVASSPALASVSLSFAQSSKAQASAKQEVEEKMQEPQKLQEKVKAVKSEKVKPEVEKVKVANKKNRTDKTKIAKKTNVSKKIQVTEKKPYKKVKESNKVEMSNNDINQQAMSPSEEFKEELSIGQRNAVSYALFVPPKYPSRAIQQGLAGRVLLRVSVSENGKADQVEVLESSHPIFIKEARKSAMKSTYNPMKTNGQIIQSWVRIPIRFELR